MTSATESLRRLLDEHGVKWTSKLTRPETTWAYDGWWHNAKFEPWGDSTFKVTLYDLTPEQAVAATLGRGTCHLVETVHQREIASEFGGGYYDETTYDCDECGFENIDYNIRFCGGCGAKVVER